IEKLPTSDYVSTSFQNGIVAATTSLISATSAPQAASSLAGPKNESNFLDARPDLALPLQLPPPAVLSLIREEKMG
ncbi:unnamed protein product, partial [Protopolystoma xenopodis]